MHAHGQRKLLHYGIHPRVIAAHIAGWRDVARVEPVLALDNTRIANLMSAENLSYDEAKARVIRRG